jgi:hypothetical protein
MIRKFFKDKLPLLEVWLMLVLIMLVFSLYGLSEKPFALNFDLKQADIKSLFEKESFEPQKVKNDSLIKAAQESVDETVDSTSKYILLCGDSMSEQMRFALDEYARKNGHRLFTCTWYSSTTIAWADTKRLTTLINEYKPDIIWFTLGSNELSSPSIAKREKLIQNIIAEADMSKIPFIWIGPPNWMDDTGINKIIEKNIGKNRFYNSSHFREKMERGPDKAHPTKAAAAIWTDSIALWYRTESLYKNKLLLQNPKEVKIERPYKPQKEVCAPARNNKFDVRILKPGDVPILCGENKNELENEKRKTDSVQEIKIDSINR